MNSRSLFIEADRITLHLNPRPGARTVADLAGEIIDTIGADVIAIDAVGVGAAIGDELGRRGYEVVDIYRTAKGFTSVEDALDTAFRLRETERAKRHVQALRESFSAEVLRDAGLGDAA